MKVFLKYTIEDLPAQLSKAVDGFSHIRSRGLASDFAPTGTIFIVHGVEFSSGNVLYRLPDPPKGHQSILGLAMLFEIIDPRVSRYWECRVLPSGKIVSWPPSWFKPFYHDLLSDGDPAIVADFARVTSLLNQESATDIGYLAHPHG